MPFEEVDPRVCLVVVGTIAFLSLLPGCDPFGDECQVDEKYWCEGNKIKLCSVDDGLFGSSLHVNNVETCADDEMCVDWLISPEGGGASCVSEDICASASSFCLHPGAVATCVEGMKKPRVNSCGDENFEGDFCVPTTPEALCGYSDQPCELPGATRCLGPYGNIISLRYIIGCNGGYWTELDWCLVGEWCAQDEEGQTICELRGRVW